MKKLIAIALALTVIGASSTAYASPRPDPVEVLPNGQEIVTQLDTAPRFYARSLNITPTYRRVSFSDGSDGVVISKKRLYVWSPVRGSTELYTSPADWLAAVIDYQRERYGQEIDGAPLPLRNGKDFSWNVLGVYDYIEAWEGIYNIQ